MSVLATRTGPVGVWGLVNWETTVAVPAFPITYQPNLFVGGQTTSGPSGVAYNIAAALARLGGRPVRLTALVGRDPVGEIVRTRLVADSRHLDIRVVDIAIGPQTLVLYEDGGDRMVLNDPGGAAAGCFPDHLVDAVADCSCAVLANIDPNRPVLAAALAASVPVVTDVHALADLDDPHNHDFLAAASVLFCSDTALPCPPREWLAAIGDRFGTPLIVMGRGERGAMLTIDQGRSVVEVPTVVTRRVRCTVGAGDALLAGVLDGLARDYGPADAVRRAVVFASHAVGEPGGGTGFVSARELTALTVAAYQPGIPHPAGSGR